MNDESLKLLEKLANKLGTTSEYLWAVLIKQAPVAAITEVFYIIFTIIFGVVLVKLHMHFSNDKNKISYDELDVALGAPMLIGFLLFVIFTFGAIFGSIPVIVNGFLNPEFWALDYVLNALK